MYTHTYTHKHIYIYIYIYIGSISSLIQISFNIIGILCLHIFFWIRSNSSITFIVFGVGGLIYVLSIVVCIPSTFCPNLGHHQGRINYESDVTFVLAYYYDVRASLLLKIMAFAFKWNSISTLALVRKLILLSVGCMFLICSASRICSFCLLF